MKNMKNNRIEYRAPSPDDAPLLLDYLKAVGSESDNLTFDGTFSVPLEKEREIIELWNRNPKIFVLVAFDGSKVAGMLHLQGSEKKRISHVGELGISVRKDYWGMGIGTTLIEAMIHWASHNGVSKINLLVREDNDRAIALYSKMGFVMEGCTSRMFCIDGNYIDGIMMGREI
jgi:RimJ/RimL family protein N-acetyltransferase